MRATAEVAAPSALPEDESADWYIRACRARPLLTREQEIQLARRIQAGVIRRPKKSPVLDHSNRDAREACEELICANVRYAYQFALAHSRKFKLDVDDVVQEANSGLYVAALMFDHTRGNKFLTYATWWIRAYVTRRVTADFSLVKVGTTLKQRQEFFKLRRSGALKRDLSLSLPVGDNSETTLLDALVSPNNLDAEVIQDNLLSRLRQRIARAVSSLKPREREVIAQRFFGSPREDHAEGAEPIGKALTLEELGVRWGVTRERVRQIEQDAFRQLRDEFRGDRAMREVLQGLDLPVPAARPRPIRRRARTLQVVHGSAGGAGVDGSADVQSEKTQ